MDFEKWYEEFISKKENLSELSLKGMLEAAFVAGEIHIIQTTPHIGVSEDGKLGQLPLDSEHPLPEGARWADDFELDAEMKKWLKERKDINQAYENFFSSEKEE